MAHTVIIGNGVAGATAARHIRKRSPDHRITMISDETRYFYSRTALMYIYMGHMSFEDTQPYENWFWQKNRIDLIHARVTAIDTDKKVLTIMNEQTVTYDNLVLATGSCSNFFGWPGQELNGVQGLYHYQDLQVMENNTQGIKHAVVVGGGLIGIEMAEMLLSRKIGVTMLVREDTYWGNVLPKGEGELVTRHMAEHHVDLRLNEELAEIVDDGNGRVGGVKLKNSGETLPCQFVGLTVGVHPNTAICKDTKVETDRGILIDEFLETNIPNVYAVGDCIQHRTPPPGRRAFEQVWYTGKMMGETVAATITGTKTKYEPGVWFNSAKFFDIEYQTYGMVVPQTPDGVESFFWEDRDARICIRLEFEKDSRKFTGVNLFGLRGRHAAFEQWIKQGSKIDDVLANLRAANFDPEFFTQHEPRIVAAFNAQYGTSIQLKAKKNQFWQIFGRRAGGGA